MATLREVEYDDFTGITKRWYFDGDDIVCHKTWDEKPFLDITKALSNETLNESFINNPNRFHKMASLPPIVIESIMKKHNLNVMGDLSVAEENKLSRIIESEYPWCKTHAKKLWRPYGTR